MLALLIWSHWISFQKIPSKFWLLLRSFFQGPNSNFTLSHISCHLFLLKSSCHTSSGILIFIAIVLLWFIIFVTDKATSGRMVNNVNNNATYIIHIFQFSSVQLLSHVRLCDPVNCSTPGLPVHHQLMESTQTHVHWVSDAIQPPHPLSSHSPPALNLSQHQGVFKWVSSLHQVDKVWGFQPQYQSFQWTPRTDLL